MDVEDDPIIRFQLEIMRRQETDAQMLHQVEQKKGAELVAFVCDWWGTRSRRILLEMCEAGKFDARASEKVSEHLKAQEQLSWRELPDKWRRQFGIRLEV